jgi:hypothetical protein
VNLERMRTLRTAKPVGRDADNELYDRGCDLVEAATAIRRVADAPDAARAVPAVLGCIDSALQQLLWATAALEQTTANHLERIWPAQSNDRSELIAQRMHRGYASLQDALYDAQRASVAARSLAGRALAAGGAAASSR